MKQRAWELRWFLGSAAESVPVRGSFNEIHSVANRAFNAQSNRSLNHTTSIALGGLATAKAFAEAGAAVVLADFREDLAKAEAEKLVAGGHVPTKGSSPTSVSAKFNRAYSAEPPVRARGFEVVGILQHYNLPGEVHSTNFTSS
jgi:hypothetical protein